MFSWKSFLALIFASCGLFTGNAVAAATAGEGGTEVSITGLVIAPPDCKLNNGKRIDVDFGTVPINKADGKMFIKKVDYNLVCTSKPNANYKSMKMMLSGVEGFSEDVLQTHEIPDLGIRFYQNQTPIVLNTWFNLPSQPETMILEAAPIINPGSPLPQTKAFTASATLIVTFQ